jgi:UDP-glucose 4-epimerase
MKVLVTGGAGFIGSVVTEQFVEQGYDVVVLDSLKHGFQAAVHPSARFLRGDILDEPMLEKLFREEKFDAVAHLAAEAFIDDSLRDPGLFYRVNVSGGLCLLEAMRRAGVKRLVFSSTAAVYGQPERVPIPEDAPKIPCNSYGDSKLAFEGMLAWYRAAFGLEYVSLRYFNACGATPRCGESRKRETHLIPIALAAALAQREGLDLFGTDYDTPDGTCIRDYVHVADIARAHLLALEAMERLGARAYNLGNGEGYSNWDVICAVKEVTGRDFPVRKAARRPGDPAKLVADASRVREELGWQPAFPDLRHMVETAWQWKANHPGGYES